MAENLPSLVPLGQPIPAGIQNEIRSPFDAIRRFRPDGSEYWSSREVMKPLGYKTWERMADALERAKIACKNSGKDVESNFRDVAKISAGRGGRKNDSELTRYACYLLAMNGDPRKPEISAAQNYFAKQTRRAELASPAPRLLPFRIAALGRFMGGRTFLASAGNPVVGLGAGGPEPRPGKS